MAILTSAQITVAAQAFAQQVFVAPNAVANLSLTQIVAGITAIDTAMNSTPAAFASTYSSQTQIAAGFGAAIVAAVPAATTLQQSLFLFFWTQQIMLEILG